MANSQTKGNRSFSFSFRVLASAISIALCIFFTFSFLFTTHHYHQRHNNNIGSDGVARGFGSVSRSILALKTDPLKPRLDHIKKQAEDHRILALMYASYAKKFKLESSKVVRVFAELSRDFLYLMNKPQYTALFGSDGVIDEAVLRQLEKEVKERIKTARQVIGEAKESFDNQLKIQKLKDTIFAVNEQLTKAKKQGAFSSLIAAKSIPKSLHCISMRLMEERIAHPGSIWMRGSLLLQNSKILNFITMPYSRTTSLQHLLWSIQPQRMQRNRGNMCFML
ncbi:hypothetical protein HN51_054163 [Arachis hypogaea]|uniref:Galacturonosyltransferase n=1 Tax=Arachis hypogaea TaxID=3818 RepID=A0A6B9V5M1_ARAHY|nr:Galacturonosyltransferase [Arachis hypogaea]